MTKKLMKGSEAIGEAAIQAGCKLFFGYPITPQNEIPEYMSARLPEIGGTFVQAESEVAAINMIYGAAGAGVRVFTSSSSPGMSLMQEGISYIAGAELPCVLVSIMRAGPGLGGILPAQGDYFQSTKGGGHGDYRLLVLAPWSVQEAADMVVDAFDLAEKYRSPVLILGDALVGQMMEPVEFKKPKKVKNPHPPDTWATNGCKGRKHNVVNSLFLDPAELEKHNRKLKAKFEEMERNEVRWASYQADEPYDLLLVAYGTPGRVCLSALEELKSQGINAALFRPLSLFPFPYKELNEHAKKAKAILTVELSTGQMIEDVRLSVSDRIPVHFYGRQGGILVTPDEVVDEVKKIGKGMKKSRTRKGGKR